MDIRKTPKLGLNIIETVAIDDKRGYFLESYRASYFSELGINYSFVQDNESFSVKNTLRGLHYQIGNHAQAKLIRAIFGTIYDVVVDLREGSPTIYQWERIELSSSNRLQLLVPPGFAHGFSVKSDYAIVSYKCDNYYSKEHEKGIIFNDPTLNVDWGIDINKAIVSDKDMALPTISKMYK